MCGLRDLGGPLCNSSLSGAEGLWTPSQQEIDRFLVTGAEDRLKGDMDGDRETRVLTLGNKG